MRYLLLFVFLVIIHTIVLGQPSQQKNDSVYALVAKYFNEKNAEGIYSLTGEAFRHNLTKPTFLQIAANNLFPLGAIQRTDFLNYTSGVSSYKVTFDSMVLELQMSLDNNDRLVLFLFKPYQPVAATRRDAVPSSNPMLTLTDRRVDSIARKYIQKENTVGLCIGIIQNGKMTTYGYGTSSKSGGRLPDEHTVFEIGSITKTFTGTLLAYYAQKNKCRLSDPIVTYLPDSVAGNKALQGITLTMLSNHTSGLPGLPTNFWDRKSDSLNPYKTYGRGQLFTYLKDCKPDTTPGTQYNYSNLGAGLLGVILEHISGKPYHQMVTEVICSPLQMKSTAQTLDPLLRKRFVDVYDGDGNPTPAWDFDALAGCGSLHSTIHDLLLYTERNLQPGADPLSKAMQQSHVITTETTMPVGLGWHGAKSKSDFVLWHNGGTYGSSTDLCFIPSRNIGVVVLSNSATSVDDVAKAILRVLQ